MFQECTCCFLGYSEVDKGDLRTGISNLGEERRKKSKEDKGSDGVPGERPRQ